jgi:competence protein ComEA
MMFTKWILSLFAALVLSTSVAFAMDKVDLNSASAEQLESLSGVGASTAKAIIDYREHHAGGFKSTDELMSVKGIGEKKYSHLADQVMVKKAK